MIRPTIGTSKTSFLPSPRTLRPVFAMTRPITIGSKYERWLNTTIAGPVAGMFSRPSNSMRAFGVTISWRMNGRPHSCSSRPRIFDTPAERSKCTTGHPRIVAVIRSWRSGFTTTGWPTFARSGASK